LVLAVSGVETTPISIEPSESTVWETSAGGKLKIPLKVTRRGDFNANLKLKAVGISALDKLKEIEVDGKATNTTLEIDLKEYKIPAGGYSFYLQTQTTGKYRNNPEAAKTAEEALKQAEKLVTDRTAAIKSTSDLKQAAIKAATESAARAKTAHDSIAGAAKAAEESGALAKAAMQKLAAAKTALAFDPDSQDLTAAKESASKSADEAQSKSRASIETKLLAEKAAAETQARAKAEVELRIAAEKAEAEAPAKLKEAERNKELVASRAKETAKIAEPRDVTITVYSAPINLKIAPALTSTK